MILGPFASGVGSVVLAATASADEADLSSALIIAGPHDKEGVTKERALPTADARMRAEIVSFMTSGNLGVTPGRDVRNARTGADKSKTVVLVTFVRHSSLISP